MAGETQWKKGQSGNPEGFSRARREFRARFQQLFDDGQEAATARLVELINSEDPAIALRAAQYVTDRNMGRPTQAVEMSGPDGGPVEGKLAVSLEALTDEQLDAIEGAIEAAEGE